MKAGEEIQKYTEFLGVPCGASGQLSNCSIGLNAGDCVKAADCMYTYDVSIRRCPCKQTIEHKDRKSGRWTHIIMCHMLAVT